jgi:branched-chain amino acid transport system permease protein
MTAFSYTLQAVLNVDLAASVVTQADNGFDFLTEIRLVVNGLTFGSIYALVALGIVLIYKSSDVVNFGHGDMGTFSTFIAFAVFGALLPPRKQNEQLPDAVNMGIFIAGLVATLIFAGLLGLFIERVLLRPLQKAPLLSQIMVTIGLGVLLYGVASLIWKADLKAFPQSDLVHDTRLTFGAPPSTLLISGDVIAALLVGGIVSLALFFFFKYTLVGTAIRAMAQNSSAAQMMGVNVGLLTGLTWMIALMLAGVAGILIAPKVSLSPLLMADIAVKSFTAAVLGGITSLPGAVVGGLLVGIIDSLVTYHLQGWQGMAAFLIIVLILTIRPNGLLGKTVRKKV